MHFDYVDIGTSDFETSLDVRGPNDKVLLVEPLFYYLRNLPDGAGIFKTNFAISNKRGFERIYYLPETMMQQYNLPGWVRGCNSLGKPHVTVTNLLTSLQLPLELISFEEICVITFADLARLYQLSDIGTLKIDTEGHDHFILPSVIRMIRAKSLTIDTIVCEYLEAFENLATMDRLLAQLRDLGYEQARYGDNITLVKSL